MVCTPRSRRIGPTTSVGSSGSASGRRSSLELRTSIADGVESSITIVSGLPRSGTSMMMQMLQAGGLPAFTDAKRAADGDNPRGYLEHEKATQLARDSDWIAEARGHAVKIVAQLLLYLPRDERYRVILDRDIEIVGSQNAMLDRLPDRWRSLGVEDDEVPTPSRPGRAARPSGRHRRVHRVLRRHPRRSGRNRRSHRRVPRGRLDRDTGQGRRRTASTGAPNRD